MCGCCKNPNFINLLDLWDLPVQVIAMPWVSRSGLMASMEASGTDPKELFSKIESRISELVEDWMSEADKSFH